MLVKGQKKIKVNLPELVITHQIHTLRNKISGVISYPTDEPFVLTAASFYGDLSRGQFL